MYEIVVYCLIRNPPTSALLLESTANVIPTKFQSFLALHRVSNPLVPHILYDLDSVISLANVDGILVKSFN